MPVDVVRPTFSGAPVMPTMQVPNAANSDASFNASVESILSGVPKGIPVTATPYQVTSDPNVRLPIQHNFEPNDQNKSPVNDSVQERKMARQQNTFAAMGNTVKSFINRHEEKQQTELKTEITTVMKAQAQMDNAKRVLAADPNNAMAKQVLERNMGVINSKLSNDKIRKQIGKAFDISFIDPSKNDTPEIKAGKAAHDEVKQAQAAGTIADTPEEKKVAELAANGGQPPAAVNAQQTATKGATQNRSGPGYAQQFSNAMPQAIEVNPEYTEQVKAEEARQKQITQYVIPKLFDAYSKKAVADIQQGNANARAQFQGATSMYNQMIRNITAAKIEDTRVAGQLRVQAMKDASSMSRAIHTGNIRLQVADKLMETKLNTNAQAEQGKAIKIFEDMIKESTKTDSDLMAQKATATDPKQIALINQQLDMSALRKRQASDELQKVMTRINGTPQAKEGDPALTSTTRTYINAPGNSSTAKPTNNAVREQVGASLSDSSSDESEDDDAAEDEATDRFDLGSL